MKKNKDKNTADFTEIEMKCDPCEYVQYAIEVERCTNVLQKKLANCIVPKDVAMEMMKAITEFYDADWCGVLDVDINLGVWSSYWWYSREFGEMATTKCKELEMMDNYERWFDCMKTHNPMVIPDIEEIKDNNPEEYNTLKRLEVKSILAVPFWMRSTGFLVVKNPRRYNMQTGLIRLFNYAVVTALNEHRLMETNKLSVTSPRIASEFDVYISLFGELEITTSRGVLTEQELKSPKIARMIVYLLLSRKVAVSPREIAETIWPEEEADVLSKNMKGWVYRLQQMFSLISDYRFIESTPNGYQINPKLNIITDIQLFDKKWDMTLNATSNEDKQDILKKLVDLYTGDILQSASSEHWILPTAINYQYRYIGAVNELMKILWELKYYHHIHSRASQAVALVPHNTDIYFWLIRSMQIQGHTEMARSELRMANTKLLEEEYAALVDRLDEASVNV